MIKILLYDTGDSRKENNEPLGIEVIGARLIKECGKSIILELAWYNRDGIPCLDVNYDLIGVSLNIDRIGIFDDIYKNIRKMKRKPLLFIGNVMATYGYNELLSLYDDVICMLGEGEEIYPKIIKKMLDGDLNLENIDNLAFIKENAVFMTKRVIANLDNYVEPIRPFLDFLINKKGIARIEGSRGCSWNKCSFCSVSYKYNYAKWRPIPVDVIVLQIVEVANSGIRSLWFTDEDFIGDDCDRLESLISSIEKIREEDHYVKNIDFFISIKPTDLINQRVYDLIKRFIKCGLREMFLGIESGCDSQLKRYFKNSSRKINRAALKRADTLGISIDIGFIMFDIKMTVDELEENIKFIEECELVKYGSNFIKKLRIQPFSKFENEYHAITYLKFDENNLEYIYEFDDKRIEQIYRMYTNIDFKKTYLIQNAYRGEVKTKENKEQYKEKLVLFRKIQFECLKQIYRHVICNSKLNIDDLLQKIE